MRKATPVVAALLLGGLAGCGASRLTPVDAIRAAMQSQYGKEHRFSVQYPRRPGHLPCTFYGGGPAPGPRFDGSCSVRTSSAPHGVTIVRFARRWSENGLRHHWVWELQVSSHGAVVGSRQHGNSAPWEFA